MIDPYEQVSVMSDSQPENVNAFLLQIKGDTSFSLFSQVTDAESLSQTWKLCSKVAGHLEQGKRLENLSWRLFHLHSMMTGESSHNSTRTFEKLSKETGRKLDREKDLGWNQFQAPPLKKGWRVNQPMTSVSATIHHPTLLCSLSTPINDAGTGGLVNCTTITSSTHINFSSSDAWDFDFKTGSINFESFLSSFSPLTLLGTVDRFSQETCRFPDSSNPAKKLAETIDSWGSVHEEPLHFPTEDEMSIKNQGQREASLPLDLTQNGVDIIDTHSSSSSSMDSVLSEQFLFNIWEAPTEPPELQSVGERESPNIRDTFQNPRIPQQPGESQQSKEAHSTFNLLTEMPVTFEENFRIFNKSATHDTLPNTNTFKVGEKRKRRNPMATRLPTFVGVPDNLERSAGDSFSEEPICFNCRGTHTPLWRRGPNDELLCNACGVFYKVHKKHRPANLSKYKYLGNSGSNSKTHTTSKSARIQCTNCSATATPMWRKAPDGNLLCNACALYYKCHKRPRPTGPNKTPLSEPMNVMSSLSNYNYTHKPACSIEFTSTNPKIYSAHPGVASNFNMPFINPFENTLEGSTILYNELNKIEFINQYPPCYSAPNF